MPCPIAPSPIKHKHIPPCFLIFIPKEIPEATAIVDPIIPFEKKFSDNKT